MAQPGRRNLRQYRCRDQWHLRAAKRLQNSHARFCSRPNWTSQPLALAGPSIGPGKLVMVLANVETKGGPGHGWLRWYACLLSSQGGVFTDQRLNAWFRGIFASGQRAASPYRGISIRHPVGVSIPPRNPDRDGWPSFKARSDATVDASPSQGHRHRAWRGDPAPAVPDEMISADGGKRCPRDGTAWRPFGKQPLREWSGAPAEEPTGFQTAAEKQSVLVSASDLNGLG